MSESEASGAPAPGAALEELLEDSAEDLYENAPCGYLSALPGGRIVKVNRTFLDWTGYTREELVGRRRFQDLLTAGGRIYHETHYAPLLRMQGTVREIALDVVCADGRRLPVLVNSVLRTDAAGEPRVVRTTVFNATDRRGYERELLRARQEEQAARERMERLQRVTAVLAAAVDVEQVAAVVVEEVVKALAADRVALALAGAPGTPLEVVRAHAVAPAALAAWAAQAADPTTPMGAAVLTGVPAFEHGGGAPEAASPADFPGGAFAILPLVAEARTVGVLALTWAAGQTPADEDRALLETLANLTTQALERARLHAEAVTAGQRAAFLAETGRALAEVHGFAARARRLVDLLVPDTADAAWIDVVSVERTERVAAAGRVPEGEGDAGDALRTATDAAIAHAVATGRPQGAGAPGAGPVTAGEAVAAGRPAAVALPLPARERMLGALTLLRAAGTPPFSEDELPFLVGLAHRAGLALENARLYDQHRRVAHELQASMLSTEPLDDPRCRVATLYRPAVETLEVGGDWYDAFPIASGKVGVGVGDVAGRGIEAASSMGQLRSAIRALAAVDLGPGRLIERLDTFAERVPNPRMTTLAYAEIALDSGRVRYACAGHPPPVLLEPGRPARILWEGRSPPLGARVGPPQRPEAETTLAPGGRLVLYTDGLVERRDRPLDAGFERLLAEIERRRDATLTALVEGVADALLVDARDDDVCLLCLHYVSP